MAFVGRTECPVTINLNGQGKEGREGGGREEEREGGGWEGGGREGH